MALKLAKDVSDTLTVLRIHTKKQKPYRTSRYKLTDQQYDQMLFAQKGQCKICGTRDWPYKGPCVDHDHNTGQVRGLLCLNCNRGIGAFKDDAAVVEKALKYLRFEK